MTTILRVLNRAAILCRLDVDVFLSGVDRPASSSGGHDNPQPLGVLAGDGRAQLRWPDSVTGDRGPDDDCKNSRTAWQADCRIPWLACREGL